MTTTPYGQVALAGELDKLARAATGGRNNTLNEVWIKLCQRINAGHLDYDHAYQQVYDTARRIGLEDREIRATMASAENGARANPKDVPAPTPVIDWTGIARGNGHENMPENMPPQAAPDTPALPDDFWQARPQLAHIRQAAHARGRSAEAVLGCVLARIAACTGHLAKLPPVVGAQCGLSYIVALTGPSGTGKSTSKTIATQLVARTEYLKEQCDDIPPGSGEGLVELLFDYREDEDGKKVKRQTRHNVFTYADEGEILAVQARRNSSNTILPIMRSAFTDATLGQANASIERKRIVRGGTYVFGIVLGIQPEKAGPLLEDAGGGTPQRFLWMPTNAPTPAPADRPDWPGPLSWAPLIYRGNPIENGVCYLKLDPGVEAELLANDHHRQQHGANPLDEHADLVRLKTAGLLAVLDRRDNISATDWHLAGHVMGVSNSTRQTVLDNLAQGRARRNTTRGEDTAAQTVAADLKAMGRVASWVTTKLGDPAVTADGGWISHHRLRRRMAQRDRDLLGAVVDKLESAGLIEVQEVADDHVQYRNRQ